MAKIIDYSGFSLRRLNDPKFSHLKLLGGWIVYFLLYFLTENLIPIEKCHPIHCRLDDLIPFNEFFLIFYCGWFFLVFGSLLYTMLTDVENFKKLQIYIMCTQAIAMFIYIVYPSRQDLRPEIFPRENILTALMAFIYRFDTNTGVCPSLHAAYSFAILSVAWKDRNLKRIWKILLTVFVVMICLAVCFVKQHSAVDVFAAMIMCFFIEIVLYGKNYWLPRLRGKNA
ncbi:MAG: phosphatase PAP2 family protein [Oscillospiraceae bacterium]|nr:phosphatase PAP2 family protein [Oscillospiraceae bacterium]